MYPDTNPDVNTLTAGHVLNSGPDGRVSFFKQFIK